MAQQTNLNVSPYFDDFDADSNYHKVLFKPGYPVQARELTGLQSILQNQIDKFGQHFFKEGAKVIPGNTAYTRNYHGIEINNTHLGFPVDYYIDQLLKRKIVGLKSGVTAIIDKVLKSSDSERGNLTLYISYISTGVIEGNEVKEFQDGELLTGDTDIISGPLNNPFIPSGESFASAISTEAAFKGSAFSVSNGVYFVRGTFVNVEDETIVLSQYGNKANCRVGLKVTEDLVNADEDETLTDNSKGFNNYAAPGADRLRIRCSLYSKPLDDFNDSNFVELAEITDGELRSQVKRTTYNVIADELARRTYDESGDYTIKAFSITPRESLDDGMGNNGVYEKGRFSYQGTLASKDLAQYEVSPGKAFVKGYECETVGTTYLDCPKPRTSQQTSGEINYSTGFQMRLNRMYGAPEVGIGNTYIVSLRNRRQDTSQSSADGIEVGVARVYDFTLEGGSYDTATPNSNQWDITLYDIQTYSTVEVNEDITLSVPTTVKGKYSGATGFLQSAVSSSKSLVFYEQSGEFVVNEPLVFNENQEAATRVATAITNYGLNDVKALYGGPDLGNVGFAKTFHADTIQTRVIRIGEAKISPRAAATGISVVTSTNSEFPGNAIKVDDLVSFSGPIAGATAGAGTTLTMARVTGVTTNYISITGVTTVPTVIEGNLPQSGVGTVSVPDFCILSADLGGVAGNTLYTPMPRQLISNVDLTDADIFIRKSFDVVINAGTNELSATVNAGKGENFLPYDEENYVLTRADGKYEILTEDKFTFGSSYETVLISNIGTDLSNNEDATLVATLHKSNPVAKIKRKNKVNTLVVSKSTKEGSGVGATTLNDGLSYGSFPYGTRVQDNQIALNAADVLQIHGVFESIDTSEPSAPTMTLASMTGVSGKTTDLGVGEHIIGDSSGAIAMYAERVNDTKISYIMQNSSAFTEGERVVFQDSGVQAIVSTLTDISTNISSNFTFDTGQRGTFYNYGVLKRKNNAKEPTKVLKVYFSNGYYEDSDTGDITTKNSYDSMDYVKDIRSTNGIRNTDIIDIRPKVSNYTVAENVRSPLEFFGRTFNASGNSATNILAADHTISTEYSFYLGRIDRIFLTKDGKFQIQYGEPSEKMVEPVVIDDALEIATVELKPYLLDVGSGTSVQFLQHKRYRMSDIKKLEDRIRNLEYYTNLSLLETQTSNMFIPDSNGLNKFKSGFFVDNFTTFLPQESGLIIKNSIDIQQKELRPQHYTNSVDLELGPVEGVSASEDRAFLQPEGVNIKRSGDIVTLDYTEVEWLKQSFATRTESVTPFLISFWQATLELTPASDTWVDTTRVEAKITQVEGNYAQTLAENPTVDPQTGMAPIVWNSWETVWTGQEVQTFTRTRTEPGKATRVGGTWLKTGGGGVDRPIVNGRIGRNRAEDRRYRQRWNREKRLRDIAARIARNEGPSRSSMNRRRWRDDRGRNISMERALAGRLTVHPDNLPMPPVSQWERVAMAQGIVERQGPGNRSHQGVYLERLTNKVIEETYRDVHDTGTRSRTGLRTVITEQWDNESQGDKVINREVIPIMRSRNLKFEAKKCKPLTRFYGFFDGKNVSRYCTPKLLEITMTSGTFQVGEKVIGTKTPSPTHLRFRVAQCNHKEGPYNAPTSVYTSNPYTSQTAASSLESFLGTPGITQLQGSATSNAIPASYSSTSTILNVDCTSLAEQARGDYFGWAETGMVLVGQTSGAQATVTNVRLISDLSADLFGSFFIPNPNTALHPRFETGTKTFTLIDNDDNDQENTESIGEEVYTASGTLETIQEQIISVRNARIEKKQEREAHRVTRSTGPQLTNSKTIGESTSFRAVREWFDPLAQSYQVLDDTGVFLTSCDVFFQTKDDMDIPMTFQLRTMKGGVPTQKVLPFSEIIVKPQNINISQDGSVPTRITFKAPVYMEAGMDYAITLASWSTKYKVFISRVGETDLLNDEFISQQPYLGSLFKSQNASTWDASQWEDLKFTLYRAEFEGEGTLEVYNPELTEGNKQIPTLQPDSINLNSKKIRVGLGTTMHSNHELSFGNTIYQDGTNATGNYVGNAGVATGSMSVVSAGFGYTPASGVTTYVGIALSTVTGNGQDATAVVTVLDGQVTGAAVSTSGYGYQVGDIVGITTAVGMNALLSIVSIASTNEIILDNVQGDFATGTGKTMMYTNGVGIGTTMNGFGGNVLPTNIQMYMGINDGYMDGLHVKVDHMNHGMYHETNYVTLSDIESDVIPTKLSSPYGFDSTAAISVESSSNFASFENVAVAVSNPGYVKIGREILKYTGVSGNTLTGVNRSTENTVRSNHLQGSLVSKYELGGVSLRRFNRTHYLGDIIDNVVNQDGDAPLGFDHYTIKLDMTSATGVARTTAESFPILYVNETKSSGGFNIKATQNMPFEIISPMVHNITVPGTSVSAQMRTVSGTNLATGDGVGSDVPFADQGYESVTLNKANYLDTPRLIGSKINESSHATTQVFPGDKSFNMKVKLESSDSRLSPIIDVQRMNIITTSNRINMPIMPQAWPADKRLRGLFTDPNACLYVSKENVLQNAASSIKVLFSAHVNAYSDIRVFYAISDEPNFEPIFIPFPGYGNVNENGSVIIPEDSDGRPDTVVPHSDSGGFLSAELMFKEYSYTVKNLPAFFSYRIKIVIAGGSQVHVPRLTELRCLTLA